jgi:hypothetical protein
MTTEPQPFNLCSDLVTDGGSPPGAQAICPITDPSVMAPRADVRIRPSSTLAGHRGVTLDGPGASHQ